MKGKISIGLMVFIVLIVAFSATACTIGKSTKGIVEDTAGQIFLYGEIHDQSIIIEKEYELWKGYYDQGMRHLFIENSYFAGEFLNLWMKADDDEILNQLFNDVRGTFAASDVKREFYKRIKRECPETIFHGTDVSQPHSSTGARYLAYLEDQNLKDGAQYNLAKASMDQGIKYDASRDDEYRENMMVENFKREYDNLKGERVMGIYGAGHTGLDALDLSNTIPCMANQLNKVYPGLIKSEDLTLLLKEVVSVETMEVNGKKYQASYFGEIIERSPDVHSYKVWRLEDAYDDFKNSIKTGKHVQCEVFFFDIEEGQVFVVDLKMPDRSVERKYYRADGEILKGRPVITEFDLE